MAGPKLTLDTNCIINLFDMRSRTATSVDDLNALLQYGLSGKAEISITTRVESDLLRDKDEARRGEMLRIIKALPVIGSVFRTNLSKLDGSDLLGDATDPVSSEIQRILSPGLDPADKRYSNKRDDIDHLTAHYLNRHDVFVTDDGPMWRKRKELAVLGVVLKTPAECLRYIDEIAARTVPRTLFSATVNPSYQSRALQGQIDFDYSNNNGRYGLGEGPFLFETRWSKSDGVSIQVHSWEPSIDGVAVAKHVNSIEEIRDASAFDYLSEHRRPQTGQIVVWRSVNGLYAATKIIDIKDDSRGAPDDKVTFDYVILAKGGADFVS